MVSVWVEGIDELNEVAVQLRTAGGRVGARGAVVLRASTLRVEAVAKLFCPVDTGHLKGSIGPPEFVGDGRSGRAEGVVTAHASYSSYVNDGTRNMAPQPFMGPALDRVGPEFAAAVEKISDPFDGGRS